MSGRVRLVACLLLAMLLTAGCWDARGLERRGLVVMIGVDRAEDGQFQVSLQTQIGRGTRQGRGGDQGGNGQASGEQNTQRFRVITGRGETVESAIGDAGNTVVRELDLTFMDTIVLGQSVAQDLGDLDYFARSTRFPVSAFVAVARGEAEDVVRATTPGYPLPGQYALHGFLGTWTRTPAVVSVPVWTLFQRRYFTQLEDPYAPVLTAERYGLNWDGLALFRRHRLVGVLSLEEAALFNIIMGLRMGGAVVAEVPGKPGEKAALALEQTRSRRRVSWSASGPVLQVRLTGSGTMQELWRTRLEDATMQAEMERALSEAFTKQITDLIRTLQRHGSDIVGFGELARRVDPSRPEVRSGAAWHDAYARARVEVVVSLQITGTGYMQ